MIKKYIVISSFLLFSIFCVNAQQKWTLRQCVEYAVKNNIDIRQQSLNVENAKIELSTSKNSRLPNLNAGVGYNLGFGRVASSATGIYEKNQNATSSTSFSVSSSMPLFTGFRIPNEVAAKELDLKAATEGLQKVKDDLALTVASYYLDVLFKKEILKVYTEQVNLTTQQVEQTSVLVDAGKVAQSQLYDIKSQLANNDLNVVNAKNSLDLSLLNLTQLLNFQNYEGFDIEEPQVGDVIGDNLSSIIPADQIYNIALQIRPQIKEAEYKIESSKKTLKVAQSGYLPQLDLSLSYNTGTSHLHQKDFTNPSFSSQFKDNQRETIGLSLSIPIFNRFQTRNQVRSARLNIQNNELAMDNVKLALFKEIQQAYQNAVAAQAKYASTEKAVEAANESFKYAQERYNVGKSNVYEFSESQTKLIASKSEQIQAKYDFLFRAKILDFYAGKEIDLQ